MDADKINALLAKAQANLTKLDDIDFKLEAKGKLMKATLEEVASYFGLLILADNFAAEFEARTPGLQWGFSPHDTRFLRSLRDQSLGLGETQKPLTKAQLSTLKSIIQREHYYTQLALMLD
jgi:hypothetical protein